MSIRIPVAVDYNQAVSAFDQIKTAIRRAGQEGKAFAELDLSHPELKALADDIKRMQANFSLLQTVKFKGSQTAEAVRNSGARDFIGWHAGLQRQFADETEREQHFKNVASYSTYGTRWQPKPSDEPDAGFGAAAMGAMNMPVPGLVKTALTLAGVGSAMQLAGTGIEQAKMEAIGVDALMRSVGDANAEFDALKANVRAASEGLQLTYNETVRLSQSFARASALNDSKRVTEESGVAAGFARGLGLEPQQVAQMFGAGRFMGVERGKDAREMAALFADAIAGGEMWSKSDEVINAILGWIESSERVMVDTPNVAGYAGMQAAMNATERPGLRGAAGTALLGGMDASFRAGGGAGEAGRNFLYRTLNPEGDLSPYELERLVEGGLFGSRKSAGLGEDTTTNLDLTRRGVEQLSDDPYAQAHMLKQLFGGSATAQSAMLELTPRKMGATAKALRAANIDIDTVDATAMPDLARIVHATRGELDPMRAQMLERKDLTDTQRSVLEDARGPRAVRSALFTTSAAVGMVPTEGSDQSQTDADLVNQLTAGGSEVLPLLRDTKVLTAQMLEGINKLVNFFQDATPNVDLSIAIKANAGLPVGRPIPSTAKP